MGPRTERDPKGDQRVSERMQGQRWHGADYVKSSHSDPDNCVFVARPQGVAPVAVKDGKTPDGPALVLPRAAWSTFVQWAGQ